MKTKFNGILTLLLAFVVQLTFAQEKTISGTVVDETNMPLPGATVLIKGTTTGASTDFDGNYTISAKQGDVLSFSYVGYADQNITVGASNKIDASLALDSSLDEVVVTALGIKRKKDEITASQQVVKTEELTQANNPDVVSGLSGKVSGLQVNQVSNGVNGSTKIVLRGFRSISGSNSALIVIDGVISSANVLKALDSDQIESINVIKGANGAALYGSEGSNGVLIVETKTGSGDDGQKVSLSIRSTVDFETVAFLPKRQQRFGQGWDIGNGVFENVTYENGGWGPEYDGLPVNIGLPQADGSYINAPFSPVDDNIKDFFQTGLTYQNSIALSMGNNESYVNISAKKQELEFVIPGDELRRNSALLKIGKKAGRFNFQGNVSYADEDRSSAAASLYSDLLQTPTNVPVEQFENSGNEGHWNGYYFNPYWLKDNVRNSSDIRRITLGAGLTYDVNKNINVLVRPNVRLFTLNDLSYGNAYSDPQSVIDITGNENRNLVSSFSKSTTNTEIFSNDVIFNFDYNLTEDISFKANIGNNVRVEQTYYNGVGGDNLVIPGLFTASNVTLDTATDQNTSSPITGTFSSKERRVAVFGQFDFGYKDFLFVNFTGRNDWNSTLDISNNSFFYPSAGLSFIPTKAFPSLKGNVLNSAKITASIVKVGADGGIGPYLTSPIYNTASGYPFANGPSYVNDTTITNPFLEPEFTTSNEFGINLDLFKSRVTLDASYYSFKTDNQIVNTSASSAAGLARSRVNLSQTKGNGFEVDLGLTPVKTENLEWNLRLSYSTTKNEVVKVSDETDEVNIGNTLEGGSVGAFAVEGEQFPLIKGTAWEKDPQGRIIIDPTTGLPTQSTELQVLGQAIPDYILGLNTTLNYKNFKLGATFDYRTGHQFYSQTRSWLTWSGHLTESAQGGRNPFIYPNSSIEVSPGVYEDNTSVPTGGPNAGSLINFYGDQQGIAENHVLDATAVKLRELSLSYSIGDKMLKNTPIQELTFGVNARNLYTWLPAENRGYGDPEFGNSTGNALGLQSTGQYPPTRTYGFSINLTF
jgi:TonB-linked SusC/RagA family outer membrane protein